MAFQDQATHKSPKEKLHKVKNLLSLNCHGLNAVLQTQQRNLSAKMP